MKQKLYLHIGGPKTGSTAIQRFLYTNRKILKNKHGLLYPQAGLLRIAHHQLARGFRGPMWWLSDGPEKEKIISDLYDETAGYSGDIFISSEALPGCDVSDLAFLSEKYDVKVIYFIRRQDQLAISLYKHRMKVRGYHGTFQNYIKTFFGVRKNGDYYSKLKGWAKIFGDENIYIIGYHRKNFPGQKIENKVLEILGIEDNKAFIHKESHANESLNPLQVEFLRRVFPYTERNYKTAAMLVRENKELFLCEGDANYYFSKNEVSEFMKQYENGNRKLEEMCAGSIYLNSADLSGEYPDARQEIQIDGEVITELFGRVIEYQSQQVDFNRAKLMLKSNQLRECEKLIEKYLNEDSPVVKFQLLKVELLFGRNEKQTAATLAQELIRDNPGDNRVEKKLKYLLSKARAEPQNGSS